MRDSNKYECLLRAKQHTKFRERNKTRSLPSRSYKDLEHCLNGTQCGGSSMGRRNSTLSGFKDRSWSRAASSPLERALIARQRLTASINPSVIPVSEM